MSTRLCYRLAGFVSLLVVHSALGQHAPQADIDREPDRLHQLVERLNVASPQFDVTTDLPVIRSDRGRLGSAVPEGPLSVDGLVWLLKQQVSQSWDAAANGGAGDWMNEGRVVYTRNSVGTPTELLGEEWDTAAGDWAPNFRQIYHLNDQNRIAELLDESWDASANGGQGAWEPLQRTRYTYDTQGNINVRTSEIWDTDAGEYFIWSRTTQTFEGSRLIQLVSENAFFGPLEFGLRYTFEYDSNGNTTQRLHEDYDGGTWVNWGLRLWTYDANGEEIEDLEQDWDPDANGGQGAWVNDFRTVTIYDPDSSDPSEIVETDQQWDAAANGGQGAWVNDDRFVITISTGGGTTTLTDTYQQWDAVANGGQGDWVNDEQTVITQNSSGQFAEFLERTWDAAANGGLGDWLDQSRSTFVYNEDGLIVENVDQVWDGAQWVNDFRLLQVYEEFTGTAVENPGDSPRYALDANYPNPFHETTSIRFRLPAAEHVTLEVFDLLGRRVMTLIDGMTSPGTHRVTLNAGALAGGVYVFRLQGDHVNDSRTMLLVR